MGPGTSVTLRIPDSVVKEVRPPERDIDQRLRVELALTLNAEAVSAVGLGGRVSGNEPGKLRALLGGRGGERHAANEDSR